MATRATGIRLRSWSCRRVRLAAGGAAGGAALAVAACGQAAAAQAPAKPTLVVLLTVDQFRADYLTRFGAQLTGGIARLTRGGAHFTNAHQDHAIPETAAGHATLLSGRFPRSTGIILNASSVADTSVRLLEARGGGASPRAFSGTTLVDWLARADPRSRALAVSGKDRSAILPIGRARQNVFWYVPEGRFTTSTWYADTLPSWARAFNARDAARRMAGRTWDLLLADSAYREPDPQPLEAAGRGFTFPHRLPDDSASAAAGLIATPWLDELILGFALHGVTSLALGAGPQVDVLSVSLSASDAIGHVYGPDSREMHDQVLRLDRAIGVFLDSLFSMRPPSRVLVAFVADHGSSALPEIASQRAGVMSWRVETDELLARPREALRSAGADTTAIDVHLGLVLVDREELQRVGLQPDSVLGALVANARAVPGVERADWVRDLRRADGARDPVARRWSQLLPPGARVDVVITLAPGSIWSTANVASHHSLRDADTHVPLVFYGAPFRVGRYAEFVRSVDLAPTLAAVLGVQPLERVDGVVLRRALR